MAELKFDPEVCRQCQTLDCLTKCQHMEFDLDQARTERERILEGGDSRVLEACTTCYACEEYCPYGNHPFYHLVKRQEERGILPVPSPLTRQQVAMMAAPGKIVPARVTAPLVDMCVFPMLKGCIRGELFEGASTIMGRDIFCNVMWLHFARNSVIQERLPRTIDNIWNCYMKESGLGELVCFHDECYAAFTHLAPAFGIQVPFRPVHLFEYLAGRLDELKDRIRPLGLKVAYQRPCSNRLIPKTQKWAEEIFERVGAEHVERQYEGERALCCGGILHLMQKEEEADEIVKKNVDDMQAAGANACVFNCPVCLFSLGRAVAERGMMPVLMSELCQVALGEQMIELKG